MENQNIAFRLKKRELDHVSTEKERIELLEELVRLNPKYPRNVALRTKFKKELAILKKKTFTNKGQFSQNIYSLIRYSRQVVIIGESNSGKSTLMHNLTGRDIKVSEVPFTTYKPEVGIFVYNDVPIQFVEVPFLYSEDNDRNKMSFIRNSDIICVTVRNENELRSVVSILENYLIIISREVSEAKNHKYRPKDEVIKKPSFVATWTKFDYGECNVVNINSPTDIGEEVYRLLNIMRIYCFKDGEIDGDPLIFSRNREITVEDFGKKLGLSKIKGAKIFGGSNTYDGRMVGLDYRLSDGEEVSFG